MAKGNNGNLLQHAVETTAARFLLEQTPEDQLHFVATHGMNAFEPFDERTPNPGAVALLDAWIAASQGDAEWDNAPAILNAYRQCQTSAEHYPNTGELLASIAGRDQLSGTICEFEPDKIPTLQAAWAGTHVAVRQGSWRRSLPHLLAPETLDRPWLFTMDPMTFTRNKALDDNRIRAIDLVFARPVIESYFASNQPGAATIFCFTLQPTMQPRYRGAVLEFVANPIPDVNVRFISTTARGGNRHIGAVLSRDEALLDHIEQQWEIAEAGPPAV